MLGANLNKMSLSEKHAKIFIAYEQSIDGVTRQTTNSGYFLITKTKTTVEAKLERIRKGNPRWLVYRSEDVFPVKKKKRTVALTKAIEEVKSKGVNMTPAVRDISIDNDAEDIDEFEGWFYYCTNSLETTHPMNEVCTVVQQAVMPYKPDPSKN